MIYLIVSQIKELVNWAVLGPEVPPVGYPLPQGAGRLSP